MTAAAPALPVLEHLVRPQQADPFAPLSMLGTRCLYVLPMSGGDWRELEGVIVNVTEFAVVVRDCRYGVRRTINPTWLLVCVWDAPEAPAASADAS